MSDGRKGRGGGAPARRRGAAPGPERPDAEAGRGVTTRTDEHLYLVTYDIRSPRRWRRVFRVMKGYGRWLQLSVFQCRLNGVRRQTLAADLEREINRARDHVLIIDLGPADRVAPRVESLGPAFEPVRREAVVI